MPLLLALLPFAQADYSPIPTGEMLVRADLVVLGTITEVSDETFVLRVHRAVAGPERGDTIEVRRFHDWTCASRWAPYAEGQWVFLMLVETEDGLRIQSGGGEGEAPILDGAVLLRDWMLARGETIEVEGRSIYGAPTEIDALFAAAGALRGCYDAGPKWNDPVTATCSADELAALEADPSLETLLQQVPR